MSDNWSFVEYPSTSMEAESYERHLVNLYSTKDDAYRHMTDVLVPEISHHKRTIRLEHEYVVAMVKEHLRRRLLRVERSVLEQRESCRSEAGELANGGVRTPSRRSSQDYRCVDSLLPLQPKCLR